MLKLTNIVKDYDVAAQTVHALKGVSITFRPSEFVAIWAIPAVARPRC